MSTMLPTALLALTLASLTSSLSISKDLPAGAADGEGVGLVRRLRRATCNAGDCKNGGVCWPGPPCDYTKTTCAPTPPCLCPEAYSGTYCTVRMNFCATTPPNCLNGATCSEADFSPWYSCSCAPGYTGYSCETNIDDCASRPCANGQCTDLVNSYSCSCYSGWEGSNCSINHDDCFAGACLNGGRCLDGNQTIQLLNYWYFALDWFLQIRVTLSVQEDHRENIKL